MKKYIQDTIILLVSIAWFSCLFTLLSCKKQPIVSTSKDSSYTEIVKDTTVYTPKAKAETSINIDSINALISGNWYTYFDSLNRVSVSYMRDKLGRLNLKAESKATEFHFPIKTKTYIIKEFKHTTNEVNKTPVWCWLLIGALIMLCLGLFLKRLIF